LKGVFDELVVQILSMQVESPMEGKQPKLANKQSFEQIPEQTVRISCAYRRRCLLKGSDRQTGALGP